MTQPELPRFKYHPDPLSSGSVQASSAACVCCGKERGYVYNGPVYARQQYDQCICPWCIADGSAHEKLNASFHDESAVPGSSFEEAPDVSPQIIQEVCQRTPGFSGWQQEQWFTCCDDAAQFLGPAGRLELTKHWPQAIQALQSSAELPPEQWNEIFQALVRGASPTAYVFRCAHCGKFGAYYDFD